MLTAVLPKKSDPFDVGVKSISIPSASAFETFGCGGRLGFVLLGVTKVDDSDAFSAFNLLYANCLVALLLRSRTYDSVEM